MRGSGRSRKGSGRSRNGSEEAVEGQGKAVDRQWKAKERRWCRTSRCCSASPGPPDAEAAGPAAKELGGEVVRACKHDTDTGSVFQRKETHCFRTRKPARLHFHCLFTALALAFQCLFTAALGLPLPLHRPCLGLPLPLHRPFHCRSLHSTLYRLLSRPHRLRADVDEERPLLRISKGDALRQWVEA